MTEKVSTTRPSPVDLTYAGRRLTDKGILAYFYFSPAAPDTLRGFKRPLLPGLKIGTIVQIQQEKDGSYYTAGEYAPRAIGQADHSPELLDWSAEQEADVALHAQRAESKRITAAGSDPMRTRLEPIRNELAAMSSARRAAAIGWIISFLQTGQRR